MQLRQHVQSQRRKGGRKRQQTQKEGIHTCQMACQHISSLHWPQNHGELDTPLWYANATCRPCHT